MKPTFMIKHHRKIDKKIDVDIEMQIVDKNNMEDRHRKQLSNRKMG